MECPPRTVRLVVVVLALGAATSAMAQTVLPVAPQGQALERCNKLVVVRPSEAEAAAREVLGASGTTPDQRLAATTCMAVAQAVSGQTEAGTATLDQALALLDAPGVTATGRLDGLMRLASMLARLKRLDEALAMQEQVLVAARERGIVPMQIESLRFMAAIRASEFDDPQGALPYFRQAYDLHRALVGANGAIHPPLSYDLGYTLMNLGQYEEADAKFTEAATGAAAIPELAGMGDLIASHRAEIARLRGDPGAAEPQLAAVLLRQRVAGDLAGEAVTLQRLAHARLDLGRAQEALEPGREALAVAERVGLTGEQRAALQVLADTFTALGQHEAADLHAARARDLGHNLDREAAARRLAGMQALATRDLAPEVVAGRIGEERREMLRNVAVVALVVLALAALMLLARARRRHRRLLALSVTDALTGLPDRRGASPRLQALQAGSPRAAVLLIDVDHFKQVNDRFGHDGGDRVLVQIARCLRDACDPGDLVARWGGEEFLVLREDTSQEAAFALAAHLRAQIESLHIEAPGGQPQQLSVSIGVASLPLFPDSAGWEDAVRAADRALYAAKHSGRNAWVGLWGMASGTNVDAALADVHGALAQGAFAVGGNRPIDWSGPHGAPVASGGAGPVRAGGSSR